MLDLSPIRYDDGSGSMCYIGRDLFRNVQWNSLSNKFMKWIADLSSEYNMCVNASLGSICCSQSDVRCPAMCWHLTLEVGLSSHWSRLPLFLFLP